MKSILLADDEEIIRRYIVRALAGRGWEVTAVPDGASAVAAARARPYDLLICDLKMPDLRGEAVIAEVRRLRPGIKVAAITGSVSDVKKQLAPGVEADEVLLKPVGIDEIRALAARLLA
jgi:CheY-like chemotaxis protein